MAHPAAHRAANRTPIGAIDGGCGPPAGSKEMMNFGTQVFPAERFPCILHFKARIGGMTKSRVITPIYQYRTGAVLASFLHYPPVQKYSQGTTLTSFLCDPIAAVELPV